MTVKWLVIIGHVNRSFYFYLLTSVILICVHVSDFGDGFFIIILQSKRSRRAKTSIARCLGAVNQSLLHAVSAVAWCCFVMNISTAVYRMPTKCLAKEEIAKYDQENQRQQQWQQQWQLCPVGVPIPTDWGHLHTRLTLCLHLKAECPWHPDTKLIFKQWITKKPKMSLDGLHNAAGFCLFRCYTPNVSNWQCI